MKKTLTALALLSSTHSFSETAVLCESAFSAAKFSEALETLNGRLREAENFVNVRTWNDDKKQFEKRIIMVRKLKKISAPSMTALEGSILVCITVSDE